VLDLQVVLTFVSHAQTDVAMMDLRTGVVIDPSAHGTRSFPILFNPPLFLPDQTGWHALLLTTSSLRLSCISNVDRTAGDELTENANICQTSRLIRLNGDVRKMREMHDALNRNLLAFTALHVSLLNDYYSKVFDDRKELADLRLKVDTLVSECMSIREDVCRYDDARLRVTELDLICDARPESVGEGDDGLSHLLSGSAGWYTLHASVPHKIASSSVSTPQCGYYSDLESTPFSVRAFIVAEKETDRVFPYIPMAVSMSRVPPFDPNVLLPHDEQECRREINRVFSHLLELQPSLVAASAVDTIHRSDVNTAVEVLSREACALASVINDLKDKIHEISVYKLFLCGKKTRARIRSMSVSDRTKKYNPGKKRREADKAIMKADRA